MYILFALIVFTGSSHIGVPSEILRQAELCIPKRTQSSLSYFQKDGAWYCLEGREIKALNLQNSNNKVFQSNDRLIIFRHTTQPEILVFKGSEELLLIPIQASGDFAFAEWHEEHLFLGGVLGNGFQVLKVNTRGEIVQSANFDAPKRQPLYTDGRLFTIMNKDTLRIYVPRSMELFDLDLVLNLKSRVIVEGLPPEIVAFDAAYIVGLHQLTEKPNLQLQELQAYCTTHKNQYLRVECMGVIYRENQLSLLYNCLVLKGYPKDHISEDVMRDLNAVDVNLQFTLEKGVVTGSNSLGDGFVRGMFGDNHFLYTVWDKDGKRWRHEVSQ